MMKNAILVLAVIGSTAPTQPLIAEEFRFPVYQAEPTCGDGPALPEEHFFALAAVTGTTFITHYREDGVVKEMRFSVETPQAFQGDDFPKEICGSKIVMSMDGEPDTLGVMEYVPPIPGDEHPLWPYAVKLEGEPLRQMRFEGSYYTAIWGAFEVVSESGELTRLFFTGASAHKW